jgi:hypothetical protein
MTNLNILTFGNPEADTYLIQMVDDHDLEFLESELTYIRELTGGQDFCMKAVQVKSWNRDLSPWRAPAVFGTEDFGDGAEETLHFLEKEVLADLSCGPAGSAGSSEEERSVNKVFLGGYSLAALFALWAGYQTDHFDGIAALANRFSCIEQIDLEPYHPMGIGKTIALGKNASYENRAFMDATQAEDSKTYVAERTAVLVTVSGK